MTYAFDTETKSARVTDQQWQLVLASEWNIGSNPNGGYLLACLLRAMATLTPDTPDPLAVTTHYLRPGLAGKRADLQVDVVRLGRRTSTISGTLEQEGKARITCTATFGDLRGVGPHQSDSASDSRNLMVAPPGLPPPDACISRSELIQGVDLPILDRLEIRIDPKYATAGMHKEAAIAGWVRFSDARPADVLALALFCDAFPPSVFTRYGPVGWVPTIELAIHVRRRPQSGWIKGLFSTQDLAGDLFIEDGCLWDEDDQLVAQSRQVQMILN